MALAAVVTALILPAGAQARGNCCFELAVDNQTYYMVNYLSDGFGYDGAYEYNQHWWIRAIVSGRKSEANPVKLRAGYALVNLYEASNITRCKDSSRPCLQNRELIPCTGAEDKGGYYLNNVSSFYGRDDGLTVTNETLHAAPPDDVYYSIDQAGCNGGHGHAGYGEKAKGVAGDRSVTLDAPNQRFLRTASSGDRCRFEFSDGLTQGPDHVGSDPNAPHTWNSSVSASYRLSWFPRSRLRKQKNRLAELGFTDKPFDEWGKDGTGRQSC